MFQPWDFLYTAYTENLSTTCVWLLSALNIPLFCILPLFSSYSSILTGSVKAVSAHVSAVLSTRHKLHVCAIFAPYKEGTSINMLLCSFLWLCQENNGLKSCQCYNEIIEMDHLPTCNYTRVQDRKQRIHLLRPTKFGS